MSHWATDGADEIVVATSREGAQYYAEHYSQWDARIVALRLVDLEHDPAALRAENERLRQRLDLYERGVLRAFIPAAWFDMPSDPHPIHWHPLTPGVARFYKGEESNQT